MLASIGQDLKFCWRLYARKPGFAAIAVATLAVGIGSNVATFSLVRSLLLRPYPFADLERLVLLRETRQGDAAGFGRLAPADVIDLQADSTTFDAVMPYRFGELNLTGKGYPEQVRSFAIAADLFSVLQARPLHGRTFLPGEDRPGRDRVVILSHGLWQRRFAGSTGVLGQSVQLDGGAYTVIGIMPEDGTYPKGAEVWVPLALSTEDRTERVASSLAVLARIRSDKSIEQARAELASFSGRLARQYPQTNAGRSLDLIPLREEQYEYTLPFFSMLQAAAVLVLLLACANVANLLLTQRVARAREIAVREALGAGRGRLLRQFILESLVLALVAGALAVPVAHWAATLIRTTMPAGITIWVAGWSAIAVDRAVLGFALALTVLVGGLFGWISSLRRSQATLPAQLRVAGTGTLGHRRGWLRRLLVASETGLALILLSAALLLLQGFRQLSAVFSGLEARSVLILRLPLPEERYPEEARAAELFDRLVADLRTLPGVQT
ncbi:MAG TPA: ABC transporter permease, partial [Acidobacteriota bacterium]